MKFDLIDLTDSMLSNLKTTSLLRDLLHSAPKIIKKCNNQEGRNTARPYDASGERKYFFLTWAFLNFALARKHCTLQKYEVYA